MNAQRPDGPDEPERPERSEGPREPADGTPAPMSQAELQRRFGEIVGGLGPFAAGDDLPPRPGAAAAPPAEPGPRDHVPPEPEEDDEEGYVPPEPGPIEVHEPKLLLAGALVVVPVLVMLVATLTGTPLSVLVRVTMGLAVVVGAVWFVALLPRHRDPRDPGAVV